MCIAIPSSAFLFMVGSGPVLSFKASRNISGMRLLAADELDIVEDAEDGDEEVLSRATKSVKPRMRVTTELSACNMRYGNYSG